jgi:MoaA/NifB/PqqE/SkfB family radical SAM enzyme
MERNLMLLSERYRARRIADRLNLYVTVQRPALPTLEDLADLAARVGVHDIRLAPVGTGYPFLSVTGAEDELTRALDRLRERADRVGVRVSFTASLVDGMFPRDDSATCLHPWTWCYVAYNGRLGFCDHLLASDTYTFGSLADTPFEEIWNSAAWTTLRAEHLGARRANAPHFTECAWCYKNRYTDCENVIEPAAERRRLLLRPKCGGSERSQV